MINTKRDMEDAAALLEIVIKNVEDLTKVQDVIIVLKDAIKLFKEATND